MPATVAGVKRLAAALVVLGVVLTGAGATIVSLATTARERMLVTLIDRAVLLAPALWTAGSATVLGPKNTTISPNDPLSPNGFPYHAWTALNPSIPEFVKGDVVSVGGMFSANDLSSELGLYLFNQTGIDAWTTGQSVWGLYADVGFYRMGFWGLELPRSVFSRTLYVVLEWRTPGPQEVPVSFQMNASWAGRTLAPHHAAISTIVPALSSLARDVEVVCSAREANGTPFNLTIADQRGWDMWLLGNSSLTFLGVNTMGYASISIRVDPQEVGGEPLFFAVRNPDLVGVNVTVMLSAWMTWSEPPLARMSPSTESLGFLLILFGVAVALAAVPTELGWRSRHLQGRE